MRRLDAQPVMTQQTLIGRKNGPMSTFLLTKLKNTADSLKLANKLPQQQVNSDVNKGNINFFKRKKKSLN